MDGPTAAGTSPLRLLVKSYSNGLLTRDQYLKVRSQLLKKLATQGNVSDEDLNNFMQIYQENEKVTANRSYSPSDWIIIILGLLAAIVLAFILYG
jgi:hypothetical protein